MNKRYCAVLLFALGLGQVIQAATFLPQPTALQELDALATLEDAALGANGTAGGFETAMLGHVLKGKGFGKGGRKEYRGCSGVQGVFEASNFKPQSSPHAQAGISAGKLMIL